MMGSRTAAGIVCAALWAAVIPAQDARAFTPAEIDTAAQVTTRRLRAITKRLAGPRLRGRDNDTPESLLAQEAVLFFLRKLAAGLDRSQSGDDAYRQPFVQYGKRGTNLLALIPGRELADEYVIVGAHYDHLGTRSTASGACAVNGTPGGRTCNGATDNAAGVAATVAIGEALRALPRAPRRSVVLALWDGEEDGLLGSYYYVTHPLVPLAQTVAYVNFDIMGADLLPSLRMSSFAIGSETGGAMLQEIVDRMVAASGLDVRRLSYIFGQERSDYKSFADRRVPTVFFSDGTGACYHTTGDDISRVNFAKLRAQAKIGFRVALELAEAPTRPTFHPRASGAPATYGDAVSLNHVLSGALSDLELFGPAARANMEAISARIAAVVRDGPAHFDSGDAFTLLGDAMQAIGNLTALECSDQPRGAAPAGPAGAR